MVQHENEYINCLFNLNFSNIGEINLLVSYLVISVCEINHSTPNEKKNSLPPAYIDITQIHNNFSFKVKNIRSQSFWPKFILFVRLQLE